MIDWNIQSRSHHCQSCQRHFADKEVFHTLLFDQRHAYERLDVCESCWKAQFSQGATERKGFISHWQTLYQVPPPAPPEPIQKETAETLLRKLVELNDPNHLAARFILAVMLERKRLLKVKAQFKEDGKRIYVYEQGRSGDLFKIIDPDLQLDQLASVQRDVAHLLEHGLETPPSQQASPQTNEATATTEEAIPAADVSVETTPETVRPTPAGAPTQ